MDYHNQEKKEKMKSKHTAMNRTLSSMLENSHANNETCHYILIIKNGRMQRIIKKTVMYESPLIEDY